MGDYVDPGQPHRDLYRGEGVSRGVRGLNPTSKSPPHLHDHPHAFFFLRPSSEVTGGEAGIVRDERGHNPRGQAFCCVPPVDSPTPSGRPERVHPSVP